jgi:hypothetical protein
MLRPRSPLSIAVRTFDLGLLATATSAADCADGATIQR